MKIAQIVTDGIVANCIAIEDAAILSDDGTALTWQDGELPAPGGAVFMLQDGATIGWELVGGVLIAPSNTAAASTVAELKDYAARKRYEVETAGINVDGVQVDTSRASQSMLANANAYVIASGATSVAYKANSGWVTLDAATVTATALAVGSHVQSCFAKEQALDAELQAGTITTKAQIDAYAWTE